MDVAGETPHFIVQPSGPDQSLFEPPLACGVDAQTTCSLRRTTTPPVHRIFLGCSYPSRYHVEVGIGHYALNHSGVYFILTSTGELLKSTAQPFTKSSSPKYRIIVAERAWR